MLWGPAGLPTPNRPLAPSAVFAPPAPGEGSRAPALPSTSRREMVPHGATPHPGTAPSFFHEAMPLAAGPQHRLPRRRCGEALVPAEFDTHGFAMLPAGPGVAPSPPNGSLRRHLLPPSLPYHHHHLLQLCPVVNDHLCERQLAMLLGHWAQPTAAHSAYGARMCRDLAAQFRLLAPHVRLWHSVTMVDPHMCMRAIALHCLRKDLQNTV